LAGKAGSTIVGVVTITLMTLNVLFWCSPLFVVALAKFLLPLAGWRRLMSRVLIFIAERWIYTNNLIFRLTGTLRIDARGLDGLKREEWYLVVSNHRSWVDILVLQAALTGRVPFLKFFLKQQLIWVPVLGLAWWALDFPFMRRHSAAYLAKHPQMRGKDLEATRRACEKFRQIPTSVMNFVEGTRFTPAKHAALDSPYRNLLPPRAGGVAFVLSAMGGMLHSMLDVTIAYRQRTPTLWDLCCGRLDPVALDVRVRAVEPWTAEGDYTGDPQFRARFQTWLAGLWQQKDELLSGLLGAARSPADFRPLDF
jgi:1-acyl-sn-glycerol-3-phosphate acyltransferase